MEDITKSLQKEKLQHRYKFFIKTAFCFFLCSFLQLSAAYTFLHAQADNADPVLLALLNKIEHEQTSAVELGDELIDTFNDLKKNKKKYQNLEKQTAKFKKIYTDYDKKIKTASQKIKELHQRKNTHKSGSSWYQILEYDIRKALREYYQFQIERGRAYSKYKKHAKDRDSALIVFTKLKRQHQEKKKKAEKAKESLYTLLAELENSKKTQQPGNQQSEDEAVAYGYHTPSSDTQGFFNTAGWLNEIISSHDSDKELLNFNTTTLASLAQQAEKERRQNEIITIAGNDSVQLLEGRFRVTPGMFNGEDFDINAIVKATFGDNYKTADWADFKNTYNQDNKYVDLDTWINNSHILAEKIDLTMDDPSTETGSPGPATQETWHGYGVTFKESTATDTAKVSYEDIFITIDPENKRVSGFGNDPAQAGATVSTSYFFSKNNFGVAAYKPPTGSSSTPDPTWVVASPSEDVRKYDYLTWGRWQTKEGADTTHAKAPWIIGQTTPSGAVPKSGSATYNGSVEGLVDNGTSTQSVNGSTTLTADFGARTLTGQFSNMQKSDGTAWKNLDVNAGWGSGTNSISGQLNGTDGTTGTVSGRFFGPQATEVGGAWQTQNSSEKAAGIYRAKQ